MRIFALCVLVRVLCSFYSLIPDCDEVFNYYEPLNLLLRGFGKQTWEYSPEYAIRSWGYLLLFSPAGGVRALQRLGGSLGGAGGSLGGAGVATFYAVRVLVGCLSAAAEAKLHASLKRISPKLAHYTLFCSLVCPGMYHASVSLLPSTFAMNLVGLSLGFLLDFFRARSARASIACLLCVLLGAVLGWPFVLLLGLPQGLYFLAHFASLRYLLALAAAGGSILAGVVAIDSFFYGRLQLVPLNIVLYNVWNADESSGPNIFGTEPVSYYVLNLLLNFNAILLFAVLGCALVPLAKALDRSFLGGSLTVPRLLLLLAPPALWVAVFFAQPHKEERFLYPIYPFINLLAGLFLHTVFSMRVPAIPRLKQVVRVLTLATVALVSLLRIVSLAHNYTAPLKVYAAIPHDAHGNVCVGREWYRYPSSFFLPDNARLRFVKSGFNGLLPGDFQEDVGLLQSIRAVPPHMNNRNLFEPTKLTEFDQCDYFIDIDQQLSSDDVSLANVTYETIYSAKFLNNDDSTGIGRLIYLPQFVLSRLSQNTLVYYNYNLYKLG